MIEKKYPATEEALDEAISFVEEELNKIDCGLGDVAKVTVCLEEMFINVVNYAYEEGNRGEITLGVDTENKSLTIELIDEGKPFNPLAKEDPDILVPLEDRPEGGLGIFIVKKSMDEVYYDRKDEKNVFVMKKKLG